MSLKPNENILDFILGLRNKKNGAYIQRNSVYRLMPVCTMCRIKHSKKKEEKKKRERVCV